MNDVTHFIQQAFGDRPIEIAAVLLGLANVGLLIRRSIWNYPFGLAMVSLYGWVFAREKLYSDAGLQVFFFAIQIYGWRHWSRSRDPSGLVIVERISRTALAVYSASIIAGWGALGVFVQSNTDAVYPFWDSAIAAMSIGAQVMMARRLLENWILWVAVDVLAIGLFSVKGLYPTAALYFIFLLMSVAGFFEWKQNRRKEQVN